MEDEKKIRLLRADEIECRVGMADERGLSLLLFKDARVDQKILDETFTPFNWRRSHQSIEGNLYCTVEIWDTEKQQWIAKQDVGTMGYAEKEKSQASDSFKRACFNWGIGRELYTAPFIWLPADRVRIEKGKDGKFFTKDRFSVRSVCYNENREICSLEIEDSKRSLVFQMYDRAGTDGNRAVADAKKALKERGSGKKTADRDRGRGEFPIQEIPEDIKKELERTGVESSAVLGRYRIRDWGELTSEIHARIMKDLKSSKTKQAA